MSSTRNSQNLLVNVFRPTYVFDGCGFSAGVVATNIKTLDVSLVRATTVTMGDPGGNVYIGTGSGVTYSQLLSNSNVTAIGANAASAISNVQNSVFIGTNAGVASTNSSNNVIIGVNANSFGTKNVIIGNGSYISGSNSIVIGTDISLSASNKLRIGSILTADLSGTPTLNVSGVSRFDASVGVFREPTYNLDVSGRFRVSDSSSSLIFSNGNTFVGGILSARNEGTIPAGSSIDIYPLKRGTINIAARLPNPNPNTDYLFGPLYVADICTTVPYAPISTNILSNGSLSLRYNTTTEYIQLSNSAIADISAFWSILYQPF